MLQEKPQVYGTQHILDENGKLKPYDLADPGSVDERRSAVGLGPLGERTRLLQADREKLLMAREKRKTNG